MDHMMHIKTVEIVCLQERGMKDNSTQSEREESAEKVKNIIAKMKKD